MQLQGAAAAAAGGAPPAAAAAPGQQQQPPLLRTNPPSTSSFVINIYIGVSPLISFFFHILLQPSFFHAPTQGWSNPTLPSLSLFNFPCVFNLYNVQVFKINPLMQGHNSQYGLLQKCQVFSHIIPLFCRRASETISDDPDINSVWTPGIKFRYQMNE